MGKTTLQNMEIMENMETTLQNMETLLEYFLLHNRFPLCACTCVHVCVCLIALNPVPQT